VLGLVAFVMTITAGAGQDSTVLGISAKPDKPSSGTPVTITAAGKGLCGAVHIDWGDGTAITYPTTTLPVAQSHAYQYGGTYTVRAQGMANCTGQATTTVRVAGPPPPPPPTPPSPPAAPAPPKPGTSAAAISGVDISTPSGVGPQMRSIRVSGTGTCAYTLDYGDGNSEGRNADLPDVVRHNYPARGRYTIVATAAPPCTGTARSSLVIGGSDPGSVGRVDGIDVSPDARTDAPVIVMVQGSGQCKVTIDFDDHQQREISAALPARVRHRFEVPGNYEIVAWAHAPCKGGGSAEVRVK
jgi:hypothetical protein